MQTVLLVKVTLLVAGTLVLAYVSRASLASPRSHGFFRFFAWEAILALALLNVGVWFREPFAWCQIISWTLLLSSLFLVIHGVHLLRVIGQPSDQRQETPLVAFEKTTALVTVGAYRYIRHPLHSSLLFLTWGIFFKDPSWPGGLLALAASRFLVVTPRAEEAEDRRFFGETYQEYMQETKMFIPFLL